MIFTACPKEKQCTNGVCMQDDWKCNGVDDCGDMSDEADCTCTVKGKKQCELHVSLNNRNLVHFLLI